LAATEGTAETVALTIGNEAVEADEPLDWTITEAPLDCAAPSDVSWLSADVTEGTTASGGGSSPVAVTASTAGAAAPDVRAALLCLTSNDSGEPLIELPVQLQVEYPFSGFLSPLEGPPTLNDAKAGASVVVKFALGGDRGLDVLEGPATSRQIDCTTKTPVGAASPIATAGSSGFVFDPSDGTYRLVWKTSNQWSGTCRALTVALDDATEYSAFVRFN
jgi:hypothetical protein